MKFDILKSINTKTDIDYHKFVNSISLHKRNLAILNDSSFDVKILATAAPSCYANIIAENEQFHACLGTHFTDSIFYEAFENVKDVKRKNIVNYLEKMGFKEIDTLITDHIDDVTLMKIAKQNIIVEPNNQLKLKLEQNLISFEIIQ